MYIVIIIIINFAEDFNRSFLELSLDFKSLELELELKPPELELELKLIVSSGTGIENNGIGIGIEKMELTPTLYVPHARHIQWVRCKHWRPAYNFLYRMNFNSVYLKFHQTIKDGIFKLMNKRCLLNHFKFQQIQNFEVIWWYAALLQVEAQLDCGPGSEIGAGWKIGVTWSRKLGFKMAATKLGYLLTKSPFWLSLWHDISISWHGGKEL